MHYYTQQSHIQSPMQPPQRQQSQQNTPRDDFVVDERWDGDFFIREQQTIKHHQPVENLFKNMTISSNTEISPPLSSPLKCNQELFTNCFREDIDEEDGYFSEDEEHDSSLVHVNIITTPLTTPPMSSVYEVVEEEQDCDYLNSAAALKDNKKKQLPSIERKVEEDDDLLIESVNDQPQEPEIKLTGPVSFEYYHTSLVQHYETILLDIALSNDMLINTTLPPIYKQYIVDLQRYKPTHLPCTF